MQENNWNKDNKSDSESILNGIGHDVLNIWSRGLEATENGWN